MQAGESLAAAALASHVPVSLIRRLAASPPVPGEPFADTGQAATLLADISGFTRLAERFAERGSEGPERLTRLLNANFGPLVDIITAFGGDILHFAGDAALAVFPAEPGPAGLAAAARRATAAAFAVLDAFHKSPPVEGERLRLRAGIGAGKVLLGGFGGERGRWKYLGAGPAIDDMVAASAHAEPDQVVASPLVWSLLRDSQGSASGERAGTEAGDQRANTRLMVGEGTETGRVGTFTGVAFDHGFVRLGRTRPLEPYGKPGPLPPLDPARTAALRAYVTTAVLAQMDAGEMEWLAELRRVSVLFASARIDHTAADAAGALHEFARAVQQAVYRFGGTVNQLLVDNNGPTAVAAWGLPTCTYEDDAARAVQGAEALRASLAARGVVCDVGVATGRVFCGLQGNRRRSGYAIIGSTVILAARLMQARDGVLCDAASEAAARNQLGFASLAPVRLKGFDEPVAVFRPAGRVAARRRIRAGELVGREAERQALAEELNALREGGAGHVVLIEGEAGIGKSQLVEHLLASAAEQGVQAAIGVADPIERNTFYYAWRPVFAALLAWDTLPDAAARVNRLLEELSDDPTLRTWAPLAGAVLPLDLPDNEVTARMSGQARGESTLAVLMHLLQCCAGRQPALVVLEDAHWLDSSSWALAWAVHRELSNLLLVIATRPLDDEAATPEWHLLRASGRMRGLSLAQLPSADALELVRRKLSVDRLPEAVAELILSRAEGHPFFSEEIAFALRDTGLIRIEDGTCRVAPEAGDLRLLDFPDTVQGVVAERIDRIDAQQKLTLKVAAVVGRLFAFRLVRDVHPLPEHHAQVEQDLEAFRRLELTRLETPDPELAYLFKHAITQEVAYGLLVFAQRRALHEAVARWYESRYTNDLNAVLPLLAHHWSRAEVADKAIEYLERAGEQALRRYANREAARFFIEALDWDARSPGHADDLRRGRWHHGLGVARLALGQLADSDRELTLAVSLLGVPAPRSALGKVTGLALEVGRQISHRRAGVRPAPESISDSLRLASDAYQRLGNIAYFFNDIPRLLYVTFRSLNLAERVPPSVELALSYGSMVFAAAAVPLHGVARAYAHRALNTAQRPEAAAALPHVVRWIAVYELGIGEWDSCRSRLARALEASERYGNRRSWEETRTVAAYVDLYTARFQASYGGFMEVFESARGRDDPQTISWGLNGASLNLLQLAREDEAEAVLADAATFAFDGLTPPIRVGTLAAIRLRRGDLDGARELADEGARLLRRTAASFGLIPAYARVAETYVGLLEAGAARTPAERRELLRAATRAARALSRFARIYPVGRPISLLNLGTLEWVKSRPGRARESWRLALDAAQRLHMPWEEGLARLELGRRSAEPERSLQLQQAADIFERLGATHHLARTAAELGA